mgnify:CR=1 FL=1
MRYKELLESIMVSNRDFVSALREFLFDEGLSMSAFCEKAGLPESTLYKIMSDPGKDFRVSTLRQIIGAVRESERPTVQGTVVGIITARSVLSQIERRIQVEGREVQVKDYPANSIEEEIIQGVRAEREGVCGIVCGPIAATTLEKVVSIPVIALRFEADMLTEAVGNVVRKL